MGLGDEFVSVWVSFTCIRSFALNYRLVEVIKTVIDWQWIIHLRDMTDI